MKQNITDMKFINNEFMEQNQINYPNTPPASPPLDTNSSSSKEKSLKVGVFLNLSFKFNSFCVKNKYRVTI